MMKKSCHLWVGMLIAVFSSTLCAWDLPEALLQKEKNAVLDKEKILNDAPFVLHHGIVGFRQFLGKDYYDQIAEYLRREGYEVYETHISPFGTIDFRGQQLQKQLLDVLTLSGKPFVHLIAHSMGGLDARWIAAAPENKGVIQSVTTIGTPHYGTPLAAPALKVSRLLNVFFKSAISVLVFLPQGSKNILETMIESLEQVLPQYMKTVFNKLILDVEGVRYLSWGGMVERPIGSCLKRKRSLLFAATDMYLDRLGLQNDGVVPYESTKWGVVGAPLWADHLELVGQHWLALPLSLQHFSPQQFYLELAQSLAQVST
ncbi:MAG: triacylglycerol lipase [Zetaproteobacteria bacterium]|nr:triacylglycerol lipase [Zetaproteobacteria bacterium]